MYQYLVQIKPLGLLYGSSGPFLSPENLVGIASQDFPPAATTFAGLVAAHLGDVIEGDEKRKAALENLFVAGPFWSFEKQPQNFCVPTPFCYPSQLQAKTEDTLSVPSGKVERLRLSIDSNKGDQWKDKDGKTPVGKFDRRTWLPIKAWDQPDVVYGNPWLPLPHLHPRLKETERCVAVEEERGSLFLENAVQLNPDVCLVYLSNTAVEDGWYRFGGEGHLVELTCTPLAESTQAIFRRPLGEAFATITPGIWGSNRFSRRYPPQWDDFGGNIRIWTERAKTFRFRLGGGGKVKRLSRGRYAVPAGTVYQLPKALDAWQEWHYYDHSPLSNQGIAPEELQKMWFPTEGYSFKHWGCGLSLPIEI